MQLIIAFDGGPGEYAERSAQLTVVRPKHCPNCRQPVGLRALGYYSRWVSSRGRQKTTQISIRRFRCPACHRTTSMLPDFAQTYRLVETDTVDCYFSGSRCGKEVDMWSMLLSGYLAKFESRLPEILQLVPAAFGIVAPSSSPTDSWGTLCRLFGGARTFLARLANDAGTTVFGTYQCHRIPEPVLVHTNGLFTSQRGPPTVVKGHDNDSESPEKP